MFFHSHVSLPEGSKIAQLGDLLLPPTSKWWFKPGFSALLITEDKCKESSLCHPHPSVFHLRDIWKLSMPPFKKSMTTALYPEPLPVCEGGGEGGRTPPEIQQMQPPKARIFRSFKKRCPLSAMPPAPLPTCHWIAHGVELRGEDHGFLSILRGQGKIASFQGTTHWQRWENPWSSGQHQGEFTQARVDLVLHRKKKLLPNRNNRLVWDLKH